MARDTAALLKQFDHIEQMWGDLASKAGKGEKGTFVPAKDGAQFVAACLACVERFVDKNSAYMRQAEAAIEHRKLYGPTDYMRAHSIYGIVEALKADVAAGYLTKLKELAHADVFSDLLETAEYFLNEGHKDPAAVMVGGVLESHLRQLCQKQSPPIDTEETTPTGATRAKKAERLNQDLAGVGAYSKFEQKSVTAWLDLRNQAAHGHYNQYATEQVRLFLMGVRDFIVRFPA